MIVTGNIGSEVLKKTSKNNKPYVEFRLAENFGKDENKKTDWYTVRAFIKELDSDLLGKGLFATVEGQLLTEAYTDKQGNQQIGRTIMAFKAYPAERPKSQGQAPAPANTPPERPAPNYSDMDDDIPF